jgi:hypothetical protein
MLKPNTAMRAALFVLILLVLVVPAFAHDVTMQLSFSMPGATIHANDSDITGSIIFTNISKPYIAANKTGSVLALVFAGLDFQTLSYIPAHTFAITQKAVGNRVLLVLTNGSWANVDAKANIKPFPVGRFGFFASNTQTFDSFALLQYQTIDIISDLGWDGKRSVAVRNVGTERLPKIMIEIVD